MDELLTTADSMIGRVARSGEYPKTSIREVDRPHQRRCRPRRCPVPAVSADRETSGRSPSQPVDVRGDRGAPAADGRIDGEVAARVARNRGDVGRDRSRSPRTVLRVVARLKLSEVFAAIGVPLRGVVPRVSVMRTGVIARKPSRYRRPPL